MDAKPGQDGLQDYAVKAGKLRLQTERVARMACETQVSACNIIQLVDIIFSGSFKKLKKLSNQKIMSDLPIGLYLTRLLRRPTSQQKTPISLARLFLMPDLGSAACTNIEGCEEARGRPLARITSRERSKSNNWLRERNVPGAESPEIPGAPIQVKKCIVVQACLSTIATKHESSVSSLATR